VSARSQLTPVEEVFISRLRSARLATADASGHPHVVPICWSFDGERFFSPLDEKPKRASVRRLRRVRNILARGEASLLFDQYEDDWSQLGYVLITGTAALVEPGETGHARAIELLQQRYPQYRAMNIGLRPVIALRPEHIASWGPALAREEPAAWLEPGRGLDVLALARGRQSVRAFLDRPVPREALEYMLEAARWAPSPHGTQPWRFVVLTRREAKDRLAGAMGTEWQATLEMDGQPPQVIALRLEKSRQRIRNAPALVLACLYLSDLDRYPDPARQRAETTMAVQSLGAALQNMLLAAYSIGLDTGWMCAPLFCPDAVREALHLDAALIPHALITVGYKAAEPKRRPHRPISDLVVRFD